MKCFAVMPAAKAATFSNAAWIVLESGNVLLAQDADDYTSFSLSAQAAGGTVMPSIYNPIALTTTQLAALAPITLASGATVLTLAAAVAALNPLLGL